MTTKKSKQGTPILTIKRTERGNRAFDADGNQISDVSVVTVTKPAHGGVTVTLHLDKDAQSILVE